MRKPPTSAAKRPATAPKKKAAAEIRGVFQVRMKQSAIDRIKGHADANGMLIGRLVEMACDQFIASRKA